LNRNRSAAVNIQPDQRNVGGDGTKARDEGSGDPPKPLQKFVKFAGTAKLIPSYSP
jgi:hypothetical protein